MARSGMDGGAIVNFLRGLMNSSAAPGPLPSSPIEHTQRLFREWLLLDSKIPVLAMLGTVVAANKLPGHAISFGDRNADHAGRHSAPDWSERCRLAN
jgi:hypothetical protein